MTKVLVMTAGTNPQAIASVLTRVYEFFEYDEVLILATSASKKDAQKAIEMAKAYVKALNNAEINTELMDSLVFEITKGSETDASAKLRDLLKNLCGKADEIMIDVTGGLKLMSALVMTIASALKATSCETKVPSPCDSTSIKVNYLSHFEVAKGFNWWSSKCGGGYYPKVPRFLESPWTVEVPDWMKVSLEVRPLEPPAKVSLPFFSCGKGLCSLLDSVADWTELLNSITTDELEADLVLGEGRVKLVEAKRWGSSEVEAKLVNASAELASVSGFKSLTVNDVSGDIEISKGISLFELLLKLKVEGYEGKVYLDTNVLRYGFHNEYFEAETLASLLGHEVSKNKLKVVVPKCVFYELFGQFEEARKYKSEGGEKRLKLAEGFAQTSLALSFASEFVEEGPVPPRCDPALHELVAEGGILITADRGLYENVKDDASIKGTVVHVHNYRGLEERDERLARAILKDWGSTYSLAALNLAKASRRHASVAQLLASYSLVLDAFGARYLEAEGNVRKVTVQREGPARARVVVP